MSIIDRLKTLKPREWNARHPADHEALVALERRCGAQFPTDLRELMLYSNGGSIYDHTTPLVLFSIEEIDVHLTEAEYEQYVPGMIIIATDSGDAIYYLDPHNRLGQGESAIFFVMLDSVGFEKSAFVGKSITEVITRILKDDNFYDLLPYNPPPE